MGSIPIRLRHAVRAVKGGCVTYGTSRCGGQAGAPAPARRSSSSAARGRGHHHRLRPRVRKRQVLADMEVKLPGAEQAAPGIGRCARVHAGLRDADLQDRDKWSWRPARGPHPAPTGEIQAHLRRPAAVPLPYLTAIQRAMVAMAERKIDGMGWRPRRWRTGVQAVFLQGSTSLCFRLHGVCGRCTGLFLPAGRVRLPHRSAGELQRVARVPVPLRWARCWRPAACWGRLCG